VLAIAVATPGGIGSLTIRLLTQHQHLGAKPMAIRARLLTAPRVVPRRARIRIDPDTAGLGRSSRSLIGRRWTHDRKLQSRWFLSTGVRRGSAAQARAPGWFPCEGVRGLSGPRLVTEPTFRHRILVALCLTSESCGAAVALGAGANRGQVGRQRLASTLDSSHPVPSDVFPSRDCEQPTDWALTDASTHPRPRPRGAST
jgi:hypothetical protein